MSSFDDWVMEAKIKDNVHLYHFYKKRGANDFALHCLHAALKLRSLTMRAADGCPACVGFGYIYKVGTGAVINCPRCDGTGHRR